MVRDRPDACNTYASAHFICPLTNAIFIISIQAVFSDLLDDAGMKTPTRNGMIPYTAISHSAAPLESFATITCNGTSSRLTWLSESTC